VYAEDVRVSELRRKPDFVQESLGPHRRHEVAHHHLHRDGPRVADVIRQEHCGHAAAAELALDDVAA
jgi:hypothetical protein